MFTSTHRWLPDDVALRRLPADAFTGAVDVDALLRQPVLRRRGQGRVQPDHRGRRGHHGATDQPRALLPAAGRRPPGRGRERHVHGRGTAAPSAWRATATASGCGPSPLRWMSPGLELNDVGYLRQADVILNEAGLESRRSNPRGPSASYGFTVSRDDAWDFGGLKTAGSTGFEASGSFRNMWGLYGDVTCRRGAHDTRLLRGGPAMTTSGFVSAEVERHSDRSRRVSVSLAAERALRDGRRRPQGRADRQRHRAAVERLQLLGEHVLRAQRGRPAVRGHGVSPAAAPAYLLGRLDQETLGLTFRANVFITPDLSIQYYGSPFVSNGQLRPVQARHRRRRPTPTPIASTASPDGDRVRAGGERVPGRRGRHDVRLRATRTSTSGSSARTSSPAGSSSRARRSTSSGRRTAPTTAVRGTVADEQPRRAAAGPGGQRVPREAELLVRAVGALGAVAGEEQRVGGVAVLALAGVAERSRKPSNSASLGVGHLESREHAAEVGAVVAVVEEADVPAAAERVEELEQRARPLRELEAAEPLVAGLRRAAADHVAHVQLGDLVVGEVDRRVAAARAGPRRDGARRRASRGEPDEDVRLARVREPVVELGDDARARARRRTRGRRRAARGSSPPSSASRASPSSARSATKRRRSKFMFAPESTATSRRPGRPPALDPGLEPGDRERAGRLHDAAGLVEDVLDRRADLVVRDAHAPRRRSARDRRKVWAPTSRTATPSAKMPTCSSRTRWPASSERAIASASKGSTPITAPRGAPP